MQDEAALYATSLENHRKLHCKYLEAIKDYPEDNVNEDETFANFDVNVAIASNFLEQGLNVMLAALLYLCTLLTKCRAAAYNYAT